MVVSKSRILTKFANCGLHFSIVNSDSVASTEFILSEAEGLSDHKSASAMMPLSIIDEESDSIFRFVQFKKKNTNANNREYFFNLNISCKDTKKNEIFVFFSYLCRKIHTINCRKQNSRYRNNQKMFTKIKISSIWALLLLMLLVTFSTFSQAQQGNHQGIKHVLHNGGNRPDSENIVITFLGDGFTSRQQGIFMERVWAITDVMLNNDKYPFHHFRDRITVYAIEVHSPGSLQSGNGYFGTGSDLNSSTSAQSINRNRINEMLHRHTPEVNLAPLIANTPSSAGWGLSNNFYGRTLGVPLAGLGNSPDPYNVMFHEAGHSFAGLIDERAEARVSPREGVNMTRDTNPNTIRWRVWLGVERVTIQGFAAHEGAYFGWYVPKEGCTRPPVRGCADCNALGRGCAVHGECYECRNQRSCIHGKGCLMRGSTSTANDPFCRVCRAEITRRLANIIGETYHANTTITSATVPCGKTRIVEGAFHGCFQLQTVTIAGSVRAIGEYAFLRCTSLVTVTNFATTPQPIDSTTFFGVDLSKITLRVPAESIEVYQSAPIWKNFNILAIPEGITDGICEDMTCDKCESPYCDGTCRDEPITCDSNCTGVCTRCDDCDMFDCNGECTANIRDIETDNYPSLQTWISNDVLHIKGLPIGQTYRIFTISGILIHQGVAMSDVETWHAASLQSGTYIILFGNRSDKFVR